MKHRGVIKNRQDTRFMARISYRNKLIQIGTFDTAIEAANAYDAVAKKLHGSNAILNFMPYRRLTKRQEEIYKMCSYDFGGLTYQQAADKLNVTVGTIQDTLKKVRKKCPQLFPIRFPKMQEQRFEDWMSNEAIKTT